MHTRLQRLEFDPQKELLNIRKHGVVFGDAEGVFFDPDVIVLEDPDAVDERRYVAIGCDYDGRVLVVVYTERGVRNRIISARKASSAERAGYHERRA